VHPITSGRKRLGAYLVGWVPIAGILAYLLSLTSPLSTAECFALALPLTLVYAFLCLSTWYVCRSVPAGRSQLGTLALTHLVAGAVSSALWVSLATTLATLYELAPEGRGITERLSPPRSLVASPRVPPLRGPVVRSSRSRRRGSEQAMEAAVLARDAELALRAQINALPVQLAELHLRAHHAGREGAREMCILLADFLRGTLGLAGTSTFPLEKELELARAYLAIEKIRFGERLRVEEDLDGEALAAAVPPLVLQPIVENAITHGISGKVSGGTLAITVKRREAFVLVAVENPYDEEGPGRHGAGTGLANVRKRLFALHGPLATVKDSKEKGVFRVEILLPLTRTEVG
jgi:hypothetical protein